MFDTERTREEDNRYEGERNEEGQYHGIGTLTKPNGDTYTGTFVDHKFCGEGKFESHNGYTDGKFTIIYSDKNIEIVDFTKNIRTGRATYICVVKGEGKTFNITYDERSSIIKYSYVVDGIEYQYYGKEIDIINKEEVGFKRLKKIASILEEMLRIGLTPAASVTIVTDKELLDIGDIQVSFMP